MGAQAPSIFERHRPVVLLEQIPERLVRQLLHGTHAVERQPLQRMPSLSVRIALGHLSTRNVLIWSTRPDNWLSAAGTKSVVLTCYAIPELSPAERKH